MSKPKNEAHQRKTIMAEDRGDLLWGTIPKLLRASAERFDDAVAIADTDRSVSLTFTELLDAADTAAKAFMASGIEADEKAAIWAPNIAEWVVAALGLQTAGGVLVPLNTRFKGREAGYVLERSEAKMLFCTRDFLDTDYVALLADAYGPGNASNPIEGLPNLQEIVAFDQPAAAEAAQANAAADTTEASTAAHTSTWQSFLQRGNAVSDSDIETRVARRTADDLSDILFTSGTTGMPKGVMTTHGQSLRGYKVWSDLVGLDESDRYLIVNPFFHGFGYKAGWLASLMAGSAVYPHAVFDVDRIMSKVAEHKITVMPGPPTLYQSILNHPRLSECDISSLRLAVTGAAAIPVELIHRMRDELTFDTIVTGYGLTESSAIATMCRHDDDPETIATTSGRAIPGVEVRIVDDDGNELPPMTPGEIWVRGYNVMAGYLNDPEATAEAVTPEGWLKTGDIGVMNESGYVAITDRKKDMFIVGGFNAYPAEIENLILAHESVAQAAVVGIPDERMGEVGAAFVVPRTKPDGSPYRIDPEEFLDWCKKEMANYKVPRSVHILPELPANASGKVLKYRLREQIA